MQKTIGNLKIIQIIQIPNIKAHKKFFLANIKLIFYHILFLELGVISYNIGLQINIEPVF